MVPFLIGAGLLAACLGAMPLLRRIGHERTLEGIDLEGVSIIPRFWSLSGLRILRPRWQGEVRFEAAPLGGGRPGHLRLLAEWKGKGPAPDRPPDPPPGDEPAVLTGDPEFDRKIAVAGDRAFARKLLVPEMRERLIELDRRGGRVIAIGREALEISGPLLHRAAELRQFLELCDAIVQGAAVASGA